ncbi:MAG: DUF6089 family protein [Bacteroidota bacterium]
MIVSKKICLILLVTFFSIQVYSQKIEFGLGGGVSHFKGDISPNFNPLQIGFGGNGLFRYNLSRSVSLRGQVLFTTYNSRDENTNDPFFTYRNASATGNLLEGSVIGEYNFLEKSKMTKKRDWTPYLFGGLGYSIIHNNSNPLGETERLSTPVLPYGVGVKFRFRGPFSVCAEFGTRYTMSDEMDLNYGKYYGKINSPTSTVIDSKIQYGDLTRKDQYYFTSITFTYTIFNVICPD